MGDAAHAMVPYYGQGMNAGMEDCTIFFSILSESQMTIEKALEQFTEKRCRDAHAICELAMYNYVEVSLASQLISLIFYPIFVYYRCVI